MLIVVTGLIILTPVSFVVVSTDQPFVRTRLADPTSAP